MVQRRVGTLSHQNEVADVGSAEYEQRALRELQQWQAQMTERPGLWNQAAQALQERVNRLIPERVHETVTAVIKQMTTAVLAGSNYTTLTPLLGAPLDERERAVEQKVERYSRTAAVEGGVTGAGGFFMGLADFPLLLGIKLKMLFDVAALYGHSGDDYKERLYLLHVFQLAFSSDEHRLHVYTQMERWQRYTEELPDSLDAFDWRTFQQEYRNYIDLAKLAQLLPVVGAPVGIIVNNRLVRKLGHTAMNAYRMRWFEAQRTPSNTV